MDIGARVWGKQMMALAVTLRDNVLPKTYNFFIENGTLLGAFRDGNLIPHDDDFDFGVIISDISEIDFVYNYISDHLPEPYCIRRISSYADKLEVYDPTYGAYKLIGEHYHGADFHYVTVDIQFHLQTGPLCKCLYRQPGTQWKFPISMVYPLSQLSIEGETFNGPRYPKDLLELRYGCIEKDAVYDPKSGLYVALSSTIEKTH